MGTTTLPRELPRCSFRGRVVSLVRSGPSPQGGGSRRGSCFLLYGGFPLRLDIPAFLTLKVGVVPDRRTKSRSKSNESKKMISAPQVKTEGCVPAQVYVVDFGPAGLRCRHTEGCDVPAVTRSTCSTPTPVGGEWVVWGCAVRSTPVACAANPQVKTGFRGPLFGTLDGLSRQGRGACLEVLIRLFQLAEPGPAPSFGARMASPDRSGCLLQG